MEKSINKRRSKRGAVDNLHADIAIGHQVASNCDVVDVSIGGMCIRNIPSKMILGNDVNKSPEASAIISIDDIRIKVKIVPKWIKGSPKSPFATVGFEIAGEVHQWTEFIRINTNLVSGRREDLWGKADEKYLKVDWIGQ